MKEAFRCISEVIDRDKDILSELDAKIDDGDLGVSMSAGFHAVVNGLDAMAQDDLGMALMECAQMFNEAAPSTLGTILSLGMMGMSERLSGCRQITLSQLGHAMMDGLQAMMDQTGSAPGDKTILDTLLPAVEILKRDQGEADIWERALEASIQGEEAAKMMKAVHGRAGYYGDNSVGIPDGGAAAGRLIIEGLKNAAERKRGRR